MGSAFNKKQTGKFVFINYANRDYLQPLHGRAIALDIRDPLVPFPSLFIVHECHVRAYHVFELGSPVISHDLPWQDWITSGGVFDETSGSFKRAHPSRQPDDSGDDNGGSAQPQLPTTTAGDGSSGLGGLTVEFTPNVVAEILSATRAIPAWRACEIEGTSSTGTAEENIV